MKLTLILSVFLTWNNPALCLTEYDESPDETRQSDEGKFSQLDFQR